MSSGGSVYQRRPGASRYAAGGRHGEPKADFVTVADRLAGLLDAETPHEVADVGCANGELLYYLRRRFPAWRLTGFDHTAAFVDAAREVPGLEDVTVHQRDLFEIEGQYDAVVATCLLSLFREIEPPLDRLLALCRPGGYLLATGLFNPHDIEVRVEFCDNSREETAGQWRSDFNRHAQRRVREHLGDAVDWLDFAECGYDMTLEPDPERPIRVWTRRDETGRTLLLNGAWQIANQTLLTCRKAAGEGGS